MYPIIFNLPLYFLNSYLNGKSQIITSLNRKYSMVSFIEVHKIICNKTFNLNVPFYALKISRDDYLNAMHILKIYLRHIRKYVKSKDHVPESSYTDSFNFVTSLHLFFIYFCQLPKLFSRQKSLKEYIFLENIACNHSKVNTT